MGLRDFPTDKFYGPDGATPSTPMQSLMETPPGETPQVSTLEEDHPLREVIAGVLGELEPDEIEMVMLNVNGFSVREIAELLGTTKSSVHRKLPALMGRVAQLMKANQEVTNYVHPPADDGTDSEGGGQDSEPS